MSVVFFKEMFSQEMFSKEESISVDEYTIEFSNWLDNSGILSKNTFRGSVSSDGTFASNIWIICNFKRLKIS